MTADESEAEDHHIEKNTPRALKVVCRDMSKNKVTPLIGIASRADEIIGKDAMSCLALRSADNVSDETEKINLKSKGTSNCTS